MEQWDTVDDWIVTHLIPKDAVLDAAMAANLAAKLPSIDVAPNQGKLLHILARMIGAQRILEIGTLGGYSTIWLARAVPKTGRVVTLEVDPAHAAVARSNIERAGLASVVEIKLGPALETLPSLEKDAPFDLIFIDADKQSIPDYVTWAIKLARSGAVIICDNVVRHGAVVDATNTSPSVLGVRRFFEMLAVEPRLTSTGVQTVGSKGWDGFTLSIVD